MKLRYKLNLAFFALAMGSAVLVALVFLRLQKATIEQSELEKIDIITTETRKIIYESALSKDPLMLMDYLSALSRDNPSVIGASINLTGEWSTIVKDDVQKGRIRTKTGKDGQELGRNYPEEDILTKEIWAEKIGVRVRFSKSHIENQKNEARAQAKSDLSAALFIVFTLSILAAFLISWSLTRRLNTLSAEIAKLGEGKLGTATVIKGRDEISELGKKFNLMSQNLLELERMKKTFISSVTHELRSPLGAIESYVRMMIANDKNMEAGQKASLQRIQENAMRLSHFVTTLLDISRIERGKMDISRRLYKPAALIEDIAAFFSPKANESGLVLRIEIQPNMPDIMFDPDLVGHVLTNLISNAIKFTPKNGRIIIRAFAYVKQEIALLRISVQDTGIGISKENCAKLFSPFTRIQNQILQAKGTGLGLALSKGIVELHGGQIGVDSEPGKGSIFWFELPYKIPFQQK